MNRNSVKGKWTEVKGEIYNLWGKLTNDGLDRTKGSLKAIAGIIRQRYAETERAIVDKLAKVVNPEDTAILSKVANKTETIKNRVREKTVPTRKVTQKKYSLSASRRDAN